MKVACLSGKGGAGKTFAAVNLASAAGRCTYIDCDVEEPNGRLFFRPTDVSVRDVCTQIPAFDETRCSGCRACVSFCRFHALIYIKEKPMVFPEVCHSCGGCSLVCPTGAVSEAEKPIGTIEIGYHEEVKVVTGVLNPGEASGVPVIRRALEEAKGLTVIDCPPGSACSVTESVTDADYCVLVAEPTAFGFHNFQMVCELASLLHKPCGVIINKMTEPYAPLEEFCESKGLPVLARIPYDPVLAGQIAESRIAVEAVPKERERFDRILEKIGGAV